MMAMATNHRYDGNGHKSPTAMGKAKNNHYDGNGHKSPNTMAKAHRLEAIT
jgi:hypothetical protein